MEFHLKPSKSDIRIRHEPFVGGVQVEAENDHSLECEVLGPSSSGRVAMNEFG